MTKTYNRWTCGICGKDISMSGLASTAHQRKHVREGLLTEKRVYAGKKFPSYLRFTRTDKENPYEN